MLMEYKFCTFVKNWIIQEENIFVRNKSTVIFEDPLSSMIKRANHRNRKNGFQNILKNKCKAISQSMTRFLAETPKL